MADAHAPVPPVPAAKSWRTTACGVLAAVSALIGLVVVPLLDEDPATVARWAEALPIALTAVGLGVARDHGVSSANAGVGK
jgi:hypothetical protein